MTRGFMNQPFFQRNAEFDRSTLDEKGRSIDLSLSSETPVLRWFGNEILLHGPENVELDRLESALINHDPNQIIGRWADKRIKSKRLRAKLFFDDDEEGERAIRKVKSGSLKGASVRYLTKKGKQLREGEEWNGFKGPALIVVRWQPFEGSLTPIPADYTVGVGRELSRSLEGIEIETSSISGAERNRIMTLTSNQYNDLLGRAQMVGKEAVNEFARWVAEGKDEDEISRKLLDMAIQKRGGSVGGGRKFSDLDDDALARALKNPTQTLT